MNDQEAVRRTIEEGYIAGIHEAQDAAKVRRCFHPEFRMLTSKDGEVSTMSSEQFLEMAIARRRDNPSMYAQPLTYEIPAISIEGNAAFARVELFRGGKHLFTDLFLLYRFGEIWKLVCKIFHAHG